MAAMERDGRLSWLGLSLVGRVDFDTVTNCGRRVKLITDVRSIDALDIVTNPSGEGCVLRSLPPAGAEHSCAHPKGVTA
jgi:hypothetical protein